MDCNDLYSELSLAMRELGYLANPALAVEPVPYSAGDWTEKSKGFRDSRELAAEMATETFDKLRRNRDRIRKIQEDPVVNYIVFLALGKHKEPPKFRDMMFRSYAEIVQLLIFNGIRFTNELIETLQVFDSSLRDCQRIHREARRSKVISMLTPGESHEIEIGLLREHSWAEGFSQKIRRGDIELPKDAQKIIATNPIELDRQRLPPQQRALFDWMVKQRHGGHFENLLNVRSAWNDPENVSDAGIISKLKGIRTRLPRSRWWFEISEATHEFSWTLFDGQKIK